MTLIDALRNLTVKEPETAHKRKLYKTLKVLGEGTFGIVKEAIYTPTNRHVALKSIRKRSLDSPEDVACAVKREMSVLQGVRHPNIIALLDWFETKDKWYLVFDLATGGELYDRIASKGKFTEKDAARIIYTILEAVAFLHSKGIVHRDLKPENLLYRDTSPDADLLIADFGVANFVHGDELLKTLCGSPMYAAPEIIKRSGHGKPADLWSIGIITYCVLAGYPPFDFAEDFPDLMDAICGARFKFDSPYWDNISSLAKDFVRALLRVKPGERPTARQAMLHPWLCKYSAKARASAEHLRSISLSNETLAMQSTISTSSALRPVTVVTPETIPSAVPIIVGEATPPKPEIKQAEQVEEEEEEEHEHLQIPTTLEPIPDDDSLPNLVERVWSIRPESSLFHRNRLIKAFRTVQAARRLSTKKVGEDARRGSGDSTGTTGSLDRRVATEPNIRNSSSSEDSGLDVMKEEGEDVGVLAVPTSRVDSLLKS